MIAYTTYFKVPVRVSSNEAKEHILLHLRAELSIFSTKLAARVNHYNKRYPQKEQYFRNSNNNTAATHNNKSATTIR